MKQTVAALQIGSCATTTETITKIAGYELQFAGVDLVVLPEATLGGYPKGALFGTYVGYRLPEGRKEFAQYFKQAVEVPGPEVDTLCELARRSDTLIIVGVIERGGSTLYCTTVYIDHQRGLVGKHRKVMPTGAERLTWGFGDGLTLFTYKHDRLGVIGGAICWENYMPLMRAYMYSQGTAIYCAPTVDDRDGWTALMRTVGNEGRVFSVLACQYLPPLGEINFERPGTDPKNPAPGWDASQPTIRGGSVICSPYGEVLAGPLRGKEGLITAEIDTDDIIEARYDMDPSGHYLAPGIFKLVVDTKLKSSVEKLE